jgi:hypothetical protein
MVDADNYIVSGDSIIAVPKSMNGNSVRGRVLAIEGQVCGLREFIVEVEGTYWLTDGALGLPEHLFATAYSASRRFEIPGSDLPNLSSFNQSQWGHNESTDLGNTSALHFVRRQGWRRICGPR